MNLEKSPAYFILQTWLGLNKVLVNASQNDCEMLLDVELKTRRRIQVALRIHGRLNRIRGAIERKELREELKRVE